MAETTRDFDMVANLVLPMKGIETLGAQEWVRIIGFINL